MPTNNSANTALSKASSTLGLQIGGKVVEPGQHIPKAEAQSPPELSFPDARGPYIVVALDMDAPFPSFGILGPILHWIQPGLVPSAQTLKHADTPFVADYIGPAPPPGSGPHRYCFFLYEQPAGFDGAKYAPPNGQKLPALKRMRYDLDAFEKEANLGPIIACNYFTSD